MRAPVGIQIRRRRNALNLSQAALARAVGISPSYLNLIENNKREVGGRLLLRIAERLNLDVDRLSGDAEQRTIHALEELLSEPLLNGLEIDAASIRDLVARHPEAAHAMARLHRAYIDSVAGMEAYANRLKSDPLLSEMLHQVLNRIAGIRSSAEILSGVPDLTEADRDRFLRNINGEAEDLTGILKNLVSYFDQTASRQRIVSPLREVEDAIIAANNHFPELEINADFLRREVERNGIISEPDLGDALRRRFGIECRSGQAFTGQHSFDPQSRTLWFRVSTTPATRRFQMCRIYAEHAAPELLEDQVKRLSLTTKEASQLARRALSSYVAGAMVTPYDAFLNDAESRRYDIDLLSHIYDASFEQVAHRFVTLRRKGAEGVPFGFLRADPAGRLTKRFPIPGLILPILGHGCPLWPIYSAPSTGKVVRQISEFTNGARYLLIAKAVTKQIAAYQEQPITFSIMLACDILHADRIVYGQGLDLADSRNRVLVGPSCLLCSRQDCEHRQEPAPATII
jgi:predicted transcriptional regulator/transcriptional regulator with XRE-family HTH domain